MNTVFVVARNGKITVYSRVAKALVEAHRVVGVKLTSDQITAYKQILKKQGRFVVRQNSDMG